jgi:hypothetical protein
MYNVTGQIINVFKSPASDKYEASYKVQMLGDSPLVDGQVKKEMLTLSVPLPIFDNLQSEIGKTVTLPIGFYVKNSQLVTFYPKHLEGSKTARPA